MQQEILFFTTIVPLFRIIVSFSFSPEFTSVSQVNLIDFQSRFIINFHRTFQELNAR